jgi:hypothetical protein
MQPRELYELKTLPAPNEYCLEAQRVVTRTNVPMQLVVHKEFTAFVKSKAVIEGPTIHQYNWYDEDGEILGVSCKMKSADHLLIEFGEGSAGPEGYCHDMNRQVYTIVQQQIAQPVYADVIFDPSESLDTKEQASMIGPTWLLPFTLTRVDDEGDLHIATKGFVIDFLDPRFQKFPPSWRGTHYCHLIAPDYLARLLAGEAQPGVTIGRAPDKSDYRVPATN